MEIEKSYYILCTLCYCYCSVAKSCLTLCDSLDCSTPASSGLHYFPEFAQISQNWLRFTSVELVILSNHLFLCHLLPLLPSVFPSIRVFTNEFTLCIRPKYWSFSFSISPSNDFSGLISFRTDWFDLLAVQGTLKSLL